MKRTEQAKVCEADQQIGAPVPATYTNEHRTLAAAHIDGPEQSIGSAALSVSHTTPSAPAETTSIAYAGGEEHQVYKADTVLKIIFIAAGGAAGALLRYALSGWVQSRVESVFPWGTLAVNLLGCLLIGVVGSIFAGPYLVREEYKLAILIGLLGAFTTFSTYANETLNLLNDGQFFRAGLNVVLSNLLGLFGVWLGAVITKQFIGG